MRSSTYPGVDVTAWRRVAADAPVRAARTAEQWTDLAARAGGLDGLARVGAGAPRRLGAPCRRGLYRPGELRAAAHRSWDARRCRRGARRRLLRGTRSPSPLPGAPPRSPWPSTSGSGAGVDEARPGRGDGRGRGARPHRDRPRGDVPPVTRRPDAGPGLAGRLPLPRRRPPRPRGRGDHRRAPVLRSPRSATDGSVLAIARAAGLPGLGGDHGGRGRRPRPAPRPGRRHVMRELVAWAGRHGAGTRTSRSRATTTPRSASTAGSGFVTTTATTTGWTPSDRIARAVRRPGPRGRASTWVWPAPSSPSRREPSPRRRAACSTGWTTWPHGCPPRAAATTGCEPSSANSTATPKDYADLRASLLPEVLRRRRGLPILLSVVWLEVARRADVDAFGTSMPGHFVVGLGDPDGDHTVVDPFRGGRPSTLAAPPARWTAVPTLLRILTNVRTWAGPADRVRTALWATELALLLPGHPAELRAEHAAAGPYGRLPPRGRGAGRLRRGRRRPRPRERRHRQARGADGPSPPQLRPVLEGETICPAMRDRS